VRTTASIFGFSRFSLRCPSSWCSALSLAALAACADPPKNHLPSGGQTAGESGVDGAAGTNGGSPSTIGIELNGSPQYYRVVRLTNAQWAQSVQDVLRLSAPSKLEATFQSPVAGTTDFSNNELVLEVNQRSSADFQMAAEALADQATASAAALSRVYGATDSAGFIRTLGRRVYRRPLSAVEISAYNELFKTGSAMSGSKSAFQKGAALVIRAMLQSPNFLYRTEFSPSDTPLSGYEVAAKLSLWLRGTTPSDELLDLAPTLTSADAAAELASSLLDESTAVAVMRRFHGELLHFARMGTISKVGVPSYDRSLNAEYEESSYLFFDKIFSEGLGVKDIFTSRSGFMGPGMAELYGKRQAELGIVEQDLGPERLGFFSQLPFLTLNGLNGDPDPIHRGASINLDMLCAPLGPPAANLPPIPPLEPNQTNRERITALTSGCGGACHNQLINPVGFAFEHFDGMGRYRETEGDDLPIDSSGEYEFSEGPKAFPDAASLMQAMADSEQAHLCYAKKLASFSLQRDIVESDASLIRALAEVSRGAHGSVKEVLTELVKSKAFRTHDEGAP
jgi:uncharacterized protein DUF1588/uncharacterized protein DUF1592/uncharacterized protein DUF1595/uncharacterized protein DUF1585/uncharacterized protein DUF1587